MCIEDLEQKIIFEDIITFFNARYAGKSKTNTGNLFESRLDKLWEIYLKELVKINSPVNFSAIDLYNCCIYHLISEPEQYSFNNISNHNIIMALEYDLKRKFVANLSDIFETLLKLYKTDFANTYLIIVRLKNLINEYKTFELSIEEKNILTDTVINVLNFINNNFSSIKKISYDDVNNLNDLISIDKVYNELIIKPNIIETLIKYNLFEKLVERCSLNTISYIKNQKLDDYYSKEYINTLYEIKYKEIEQLLNDETIDKKIRISAAKVLNDNVLINTDDEDDDEDDNFDF